MAKVSVIVPMYNVSSVLDRCIETLFSQTLNDIELVFVDDCSSDDTLERLNVMLPQKKGVEVRILHHEINRGVAAARNTGLAVAKGDFIYYVDADEYIEPITLELL